MLRRSPFLYLRTSKNQRFSDYCKPVHTKFGLEHFSYIKTVEIEIYMITLNKINYKNRSHPKFRHPSR